MTQFDKIKIDPENLAADGGEAIRRRWSRQIWSGHRWLKIYWLAILSGISLTIFTIYMIVNNDWQLLNSTVIQVWFGLNALLFIFLRIQIGALGGLIAFPFFSDEQFPQIRATDIKTSEIFKAMLRYAFSFDIPVISLLCTFHVVVFITAIEGGPHRLDSDFILTVPYIFVGMFGLVSSYIALGYIGCLLIRKPFGAVIGAMFPLFMLILTALLSVSSIFFSFIQISWWDFLLTCTVALTVPEAIFQSFMNGALFFWTSLDPIMVLNVNFLIVASFLWGLLYGILKKRREYGGFLKPKS